MNWQCSRAYSIFQHTQKSYYWYISPLYRNSVFHMYLHPEYNCSWVISEFCSQHHSNFWAPAIAYCSNSPLWMADVFSNGCTAHSDKRSGWNGSGFLHSLMSSLGAHDTCMHAYGHTFIRTYRHPCIHTDIHTYLRTYIHTLHSISFHSIAFYCITLHYTTLHYITIHTYVTYIHTRTYIHTYIHTLYINDDHSNMCVYIYIW